MKKAKTVSVFLLSALALGGLAACGARKLDLTVDFKVLNDQDQWTILKTEKVVGGAVTVPNAPAKQYYDFGGWFKEESFTTPFVETGIKESCSAYAKYVAQEVTVYINDDEPIVKDLIDVVNATYNPGEGLEFDGWYKDAAKQVKWNGTDPVTELYAESMAMITFNNGYEDVFTALVKPGSTFANPSTTEVTLEDGTVTTYEKHHILKSYMDEEDINYVDEEGNPFNFDKAITKNQKITVNFNSVGMKKYVSFDEAKNQWILKPRQFNSWGDSPVLSIQSTYTVGVANEAGEEVPTKVKVEAVDVQGNEVIKSDMTKIIIGEGIKSIGGLNYSGATQVKNITLPKSLKIIDNCFNNLNNLESVTLNEGLEVIIGSFFKNAHLDDDYKWFDFGENHTFDITIPASVKNMAMVPTNLKFAEGSKFSLEDGRIVLNDGAEKILIADNEHINDGTIVVPEGITKIQAGTYPYPFEYMMLPSTFKNVNYNARIEDYPYYSRDCQSPKAFHLFDEVTLGKDTLMDRTAFAITPALGGVRTTHPAAPINFYQGFGIVKFNSDAVPTELHPWAFTGDSTGKGWYQGTCQPSSDEALKKYFVTNDDVDKLYISLRLEVADQPLKETYHSFNSIIDTKKINNVNELVEAVKTDVNNARYAEEIATLTEGKTLSIYSQGVEITADKITGEMFLTVTVKPAN